jgi:anti-sigma B factor antagonist
LFAWLKLKFLTGWMMELIEISVCAEKDVYQITLNGDLDACSSIVLDQVLEEACVYKPHAVFIDCEKLNYISSSGLGAIICHLESYNQNHIQLVLVNVQATISSICQLVGLNKFISIQAPTLKVDKTFSNSIAHYMSSDGDKHQSS